MKTGGTVTPYLDEGVYFLRDLQLFCDETKPEMTIPCWQQDGPRLQDIAGCQVRDAV